MQLAGGSLWGERKWTEQHHANTQNAQCLSTAVVRPETSHALSSSTAEIPKRGREDSAATPTASKGSGNKPFKSKMKVQKRKTYYLENTHSRHRQLELTFTFRRHSEGSISRRNFPSVLLGLH